MGGCTQVVGFIIVIALVAFFCGLLSFTTIDSAIQDNFTERFTSSAGDVAENNIESSLGVALPESATDYYHAAKGDSALWFRFSVPPGNASGVFSGSTLINCPSGVPLFAGFRPVFAQPRLLDSNQTAQISNWWQPQAPSVYSARECTGQNFQIVRMMVDTGDPNLFTFFVEVVQP